MEGLAGARLEGSAGFKCAKSWGHVEPVKFFFKKWTYNSHAISFVLLKYAIPLFLAYS